MGSPAAFPAGSNSMEMDTSDLSNDGSSTTLSVEPSPPPGKRRSKKDGKENGKVDTGIPEPMLPPCRICSEKASGFHYGANTCEACKAFFRRSLRKGAQYKCAASGKCEIMPGKRNSCPACRLQKCVDIGMSKSAIKTGRYTHAKRAQDIMEVKGLKEPPTPTLSPDAEIQEIVSPDQSKMQQSDSSPSLKMPRSPSPVTSLEEIEYIIQRITGVQLNQTVWTAEFVEKKAESEKLYLEQRLLSREIFGPMKPITGEEYTHIYQSTGIDVDGRRDLMQNAFLPYIEESIKRYVTFVKSIPGFNQLPMPDQTSLVKASRFDCWMILAQQAFNPTDKLYTNHGGRIISIDEMNLLSNANDENEMVFQLQHKLQKLGLTEEENCILAAMSVMSTDSCVLINPAHVGRCHSVLLNCLRHLVGKNHADDPLFIARIVAVLVEIRSVREVHKLIEEQVAMQWCDKVDIPPLLYEMWSSC